MVLDPTIRPVPGEVVRLSGPGREWSVRTSATGEFRFDNVGRGRYRLGVDVRGFEPVRQPVLIAGQPVRVALRLTLAQLREEITVSDQAQRITTEADNAASAISVERGLLENLPVLGLEYLTALSRFLDPGTAGAAGASLIVDGMEAREVGVTPSAIQEIRINQNPYTAEYPRWSRRRIEVITKSAADRHHGTLNFLFRDYRLDARAIRLRSSGPPSSGAFSRAACSAPEAVRKRCPTCCRPCAKARTWFRSSTPGARPARASSMLPPRSRHGGLAAHQPAGRRPDGDVLAAEFPGPLAEQRRRRRHRAAGSRRPEPVPRGRVHLQPPPRRLAAAGAGLGPRPQPQHGDPRRHRLLLRPLRPGPIWDLLRYDGVRLRRYVLTSPPADAGALEALLAAAPASIARLQPRAELPEVFQFSAGVERQLARRTTLAAQDVGTRGCHQFRSRDANGPLPPAFAARPDPAVNPLRVFESACRLQGDALEPPLRGTLGRGVTGQAQYTFGRTLSDTGGLNWYPADSFHPHGEWGRSDTDRRHQFHLLRTARLHRSLDLGFAVWLQSGIPFNITTGRDDNRDGLALDRPAGVTRNTGRGPGYAAVDLRWFREFRLRRSSKEGAPAWTVSLDAFNVLNHPNCPGYLGALSSPLFGRPAVALPPRRLQADLRFQF